MLPGNCLLFLGRGGSAPPVRKTTRRGGGLAGLVPLPRPHLLPSADDGRCLVPVGGQEPPQELHPGDGLQGGIKVKETPPTAVCSTLKQPPGLRTSLHIFCLTKGGELN